MSQAFQPGDVVRLKSGGPTMTVAVITDRGGIRCTWFPSDEKAMRDTFNPTSLELIHRSQDDS